MQKYVVINARNLEKCGIIGANNARDAVKYFLSLTSNVDSFEARNYFVFEMEDAEVVEVKPEFSFTSLSLIGNRELTTVVDELSWSVVLGEPMVGMSRRSASLVLDGITVFSQIVYDEDAHPRTS